MADYLSQFTGSEIDARLAKVPQLESAVAGKQATLVSGSNIKTINGQPVLGSGNLQIREGDPDAVKFSEQTLSESQQQQARQNIGAASLGDVQNSEFVTVTTLPTASAETMGKIYLVGPDENDNYARYITQQDGSTYEWVPLGTTNIDLSEYAKIEQLLDGTLVPLLAENLKGWAERSDQNVESAMTDIVRTTGGDESINADSGATLLSIIATSDFAASELIVSGFNLLRLQSDNGLAVAVGTGYYFPVPALTFGTYGTAEQNNGVLFTDNNGNNLTPTVRFKALSDGVPTSINDGVAASYTDSNGKRFYLCTEPGYLIVSGITIANTCAHMAWSKKYDKFVSPTDANDAGTVIDLTPLGTMRVVGAGANIIADRADRISGTQMRLTTNVGRTAPTWTRGTQDAETGLYPYTATISGIKAGGIAEFEGSGKPEIFVEGTTLTYYSDSATALSDYVKYQLATPTTANKNVATGVTALNDWGIDALIGASGSAIINWQYAQGIPDALVQLLSKIDNSTVPVIAAAFAEQDARIQMLEKRLTDTLNRINAFIGLLDAEDYFRYTAPLWLECSTTGAPAAARVPDNWDIDKMGVWAGVPRFIGQVYVDTAGKKVYMATAVTNSTNDWSLLN
jgi:hypothetical protein